MISKFLLLFGGLLAWSIGAGAQSTVGLAKDWEKAVVPFNPRNNVSLCVDRKHNVHLIAYDGSWITYASSGDMLRESHEERLKGAFSVACSDDDTVVVGVSKTSQIQIFSLDHQYLRSLNLGEGFGRILCAKNGSAIALSRTRDTVFAKVDLKGSDEGRTLAKFGRAPASLAPSISPSRAGTGVFDRKREQLIYITKNPEQILVYSGTGDLVSSKDVADAVRPKGAQRQDSTTENDEAVGIFPAGNRYIVNIWQEDLSPARGTVASHLRYQILDEQFRVIGYASAEGIGTIVAADDEGSVYAIAGGEKFSLVKAHLE
jgi:hypothetical protein